MLPQRPTAPELFLLMRSCEAWWREHPELHVRPAVVMVSGGVDSMSLWAAIELCMAEQSICFQNFVVAHIGYPYRRAAVAEARFLETHARALGRSFELYKPRLPESLTAENREDQARRWRLEFCLRLEQKYSGAFFMLGRHAQDQIEDYWLRVFRHPTPWTWHAPADAPVHQAYPLASVPRRVLHTAYPHMGWPAFFDHTNTALQYRRNAIRQQVQQLQVAATPDRIESDFETHGEFVEISQMWREGLRQACEEKMTQCLGASWQQRTALDLRVLKAHPDFLPIAVWTWLQAHGSHKTGINTTVYRQLIRACWGLQFPKTFVFPKLGSVVVRSGEIVLH